jgi:CubicO group peptidase (beta-lactamase class C family)
MAGVAKGQGCTGGKIGRRGVVAGTGWLALAAAFAPARSAAGLDRAIVEATLARAQALPGLRSLLVARHGEELLAERLRGPGLDTPVNVKSISKSVIAALVGAAIARGVLEGVDQPVAPVLDGLVPPDADPRIRAITVDHLLTMRAGLERTYGPGRAAQI